MPEQFLPRPARTAGRIVVWTLAAALAVALAATVWVAVRGVLTYGHLTDAQSTFRESDATGALAPVAIVLPSDARGVYNIAAASATSAGGTASAVIDASGDGGALPISGFDSGQLMGLWIGGGALLLAGAVIIGAAAYRRHRNQNDD